MAFPTGTMTETTLAESIPTLWGEKINEFYKNRLMAADFFVDRSSELAGGGSALYTPNLTEFDANSKTVATAVTLNQPTDTKVTLTVNQWYEVSWAIEDNDLAQVKHSYFLQNRYAESAGFTMAEKLEVALTSLFSAFDNSVGTSTTTLTDSVIREAINTLEEGAIDTQYDCAYFISPAVFWKQIQNLDKFSLAVNSPANDPTAKLPKATLYGIPVFVSNNIQYVSGITGRSNCLAHKDAIHWATSPLGSNGSAGSSMTGKYHVRVQTNYIPEYLSTLTTADLQYGVIENRGTAGVTIFTKE